MGTCCSDNHCPTHPSEKITKICMSEGCIEPLCPLCVEQHREMHKRSGFQPKIEIYSDVIQKIKSKQKKIEKQKTTDSEMKEILPRSNYVKELTREYFIQKAKKNHENHGSKVQIQGVLSDLEAWEEMRSKPWVKNKVKQFLKDNLTANSDVVGKNFEYLYQ